MHLTEIHAPMNLWDTKLRQIVRVSSVSDRSVVAKPRDGEVRIYQGADLDRLRRPTKAEGSR